MNKQEGHRPYRRFEDAERIILPCEFEQCLHCGEALVDSRTYHMRKYVQTLAGALYVSGKKQVLCE